MGSSGKVFEPEKAIAERTRTFVVGPYLGERSAAASGILTLRAPEARLAEAVGLTQAIDLFVADTIMVPIRQLRPATYLGLGKVEEIARRIEAEEIGLVVMDCALSPVQQRNLEQAFKAKVIDRTGLILEIFGRRASTREGRLQVELAHLAYQKSRLVRSWTHLERQRGGFGFLGGPGETQIETDRRLIQERMTRIEKDLEEVKRTRALHRASRDKVPYPTVALVGYTNAGKSSLFNRMTEAEVLAKDMLFATLDPTTRALALPHGLRIVLSDTVGFISDLPTQLVAAFRATLEDVISARIILHVRDIANPDTEAQELDVRQVLGELGIAGAETRRIVEVWNKADLLPAAEAQRLSEVAARRGKGAPILVSAMTGAGIPALLAEIERRLAEGRETLTITLAADDGAGLAWLYENAEVLARKTGRTGKITLTIRAGTDEMGRIRRKFAL
ncbi:MAG: GTPase HflX [Proteobacteria bacterium]|nr:GTPase HflX [Pseudomonadota bacterium]